MPTHGKLRIEYRPVGKLKPYQKNARIHPPAQVTKIRHLIERFGWTNPILVDGKNGIIAGHGRLQAALQMDMLTVPVIELAGLSSGEKRAYLLADNRIATEAGWDEDLLAVEFSDLKAMGMDLGLTAFDPDEIDDFLTPSPSGEPPEPPTPGLPKHAASRTGDLWIMGDHHLLCADSTKVAAVRTLMGGKQAQCVFTDPPYGISYEAPSGAFETIQGDDLRRGQLAHLLHGAFSAAIEHTQEDAAWYVWHASVTREEFTKALRDVGLVELGTIIWVKPGMVLGWSNYRWQHEPCLYAARQGVRPAHYGPRTETTVWRMNARTPNGMQFAAIGSGLTLTTPEGAELYVTNAPPKGRKVRHVHLEPSKPILMAATGQADGDVWEVSRDNSHGKQTSTYHPTQKPVELARRAIGNSTQEGDIVLDLFAGSGSTLMAAEQLKRCGYAIEIDPRYVDVAVRRWQEFTGKEARHGTEKKTFDAIAKARAGSRKAG